jgi:hypothetical protein
MALPMAVVGFQSCESEDNNNPNQEWDGMEEVIVNLKPNVNAREAFRIINEVGLHVTMMFYGDYVVSLPPDKQQFLIDALVKKDYVFHYGGSALFIRPDSIGNRMFLSLALRNMHVLFNQMDWLSTMAELSINELGPTSTGYEIFFKAPQARVDYYLRLFRSYEAVQSADVSRFELYTDDLP